ncbi:MAG: hypothetical protein FWG40_12825 [Peptococcaceae bacterium]|nr:hypothetical protein [Peptococcaceae bacterium]
MAISANVRHYFLEANTPCGQISLVPDLTAECFCTYLLTGNVGLDKSTFIKLMGIQLSDRRHDVDYIRQTRDPDALAGLFLPGARIGLLDLDSFTDGEHGQIPVKIDLGDCLHKSKRERKDQEISGLLKKQRDLEAECDRLLVQEYVLSNEADTGMTEQNLLEQLTGRELPHFFYNLRGAEATHKDEIRQTLDFIKQNKVSYCFLHALLGEGWANYAPRFLRKYDRICVEDADGSDTVLQEILSEIKSLGQKIEIVLHPVFPFRVIGIVFPWRNLAVWKGNPVNPEEQGLKKRHGNELVRVLEETRSVRQKVKNLMYECVSVRRLDEARNDLMSEILGQMKSCGE